MSYLYLKRILIMAAPVRENRQPIPIGGRPSIISGGRHYEANPRSAKYFEALGLSELLAQDPRLASSRDLTEAELAAGGLAKPLYRDNMSICERIQTLSLVAIHGSDFVITVEPIVRHWKQGSPFYSFYEQVAQDPTKWAAIRLIVSRLAIKTTMIMIELVTAIQSCPNQGLEGFCHIVHREDTPHRIKELLIQLSMTTTPYDLESFLAFSRLPLCYRMGAAQSRMAALASLNQVSKESRQALADLVNSHRDYNNLLYPLSQLKASDWQFYIDAGRNILPSGDLRKIIDLLIAAENPSILIDLLNLYVTTDENTRQRSVLFQFITQLPINTHEVLHFIEGPGTIEEARLIVRKMIDSEQRLYLIDLFRDLISTQTPLLTILSLIELLEAHIPWKSALRHVFRKATYEGSQQHLDLDPGREMEQLSQLLCNVPPRELIFGDRGTLQRAVLQMKDYFAPILQDQALDSTNPSDDQKIKAAQLGNMLVLLIANGIKLPPDIFPLGELVCDDLPRGPLIEIIKQKLSQEGLWKVSRPFGELLIHPSLPLSPTLHQPLPILLSDTAEMRLEIRRYIESNRCQSAAAVFPPTLAIDVKRRCLMLLCFQQLKIEGLPPPIYENFIRFLMESDEEDRLWNLEQLQRLSPEVVRELLTLDHEKLTEIFSFMKQCGNIIATPLLNEVAIHAMHSDCSLFSSAFYTCLPSDSPDTKVLIFLSLTNISSKEKYIKFLGNYPYQLGRMQIIHSLYRMDSSNLDLVLAQLANFAPFPTIYKFVDLNPDERQTLLKSLAEFCNEKDNPDSRNALFQLLCNIPTESHEMVLCLLQESLHPHDDGEERQHLLSLVAPCETARSVEETVAAHYRSSTQGRFHPNKRTNIQLNPQEPTLPQLFPHLRNPLTQEPKMKIQGDPGQDAGGPSRQILNAASHEIPDFYPFFAKTFEGTWTIFQKNGELTDEEREKALSLGSLLLLMSMLGVIMPAEAHLDPAFFHEISYYSGALLAHKTMEALLSSYGKTFEELQSLYEIFYGYQITKFGAAAFPVLEKRERAFDELSEDQATLLEGIRTKALHFYIARGLSRGGLQPCLPIIGRLLTCTGNLREILTDKSTWNFDIEGDSTLLIDYFMRWLNDCSDQQLADFVFSIRGTTDLPLGQKLNMETGNLQGPFVHSCFHSIEMPPIPLESDIRQIDERIAAEKLRLGELPVRLEALLEEQAEALRRLGSQNPTDHDLSELRRTHAVARAPFERELDELNRLEELEARAFLRSYPFFKALMDNLPMTHSHA